MYRTSSHEPRYKRTPHERRHCHEESRKPSEESTSEDEDEGSTDRYTDESEDTLGSIDSESIQKDSDYSARGIFDQADTKFCGSENFIQNTFIANSRIHKHDKVTQKNLLSPFPSFTIPPIYKEVSGPPMFRVSAIKHSESAEPRNNGKQPRQTTKRRDSYEDGDDSVCCVHKHRQPRCQKHGSKSNRSERILSCVPAEQTTNHSGMISRPVTRVYPNHAILPETTRRPRTADWDSAKIPESRGKQKDRTVDRIIPFAPHVSSPTKSKRSGRRNSNGDVVREKLVYVVEEKGKNVTKVETDLFTLNEIFTIKKDLMELSEFAKKLKRLKEMAKESEKGKNQQNLCHCQPAAELLKDVNRRIEALEARQEELERGSKVGQKGDTETESKKTTDLKTSSDTNTAIMPEQSAATVPSILKMIFPRTDGLSNNSEIVNELMDIKTQLQKLERRRMPKMVPQKAPLVEAPPKKDDRAIAVFSSKTYILAENFDRKKEETEEGKTYCEHQHHTEDRSRKDQAKQDVENWLKGVSPENLNADLGARLQQNLQTGRSQIISDVKCRNCTQTLKSGDFVNQEPQKNRAILTGPRQSELNVPGKQLDERLHYNECIVTRSGRIFACLSLNEKLLESTDFIECDENPPGGFQKPPGGNTRQASFFGTMPSAIIAKERARRMKTPGYVPPRVIRTKSLEELSESFSVGKSEKTARNMNLKKLEVPTLKDKKHKEDKNEFVKRLEAHLMALTNAMGKANPSTTTSYSEFLASINLDTGTIDSSGSQRNRDRKAAVMTFAATTRVEDKSDAQDSSDEWLKEKKKKKKAKEEKKMRKKKESECKKLKKWKKKFCMEKGDKGKKEKKQKEKKKKDKKQKEKYKEDGKISKPTSSEEERMRCKQTSSEEERMRCKRTSSEEERMRHCKQAEREEESAPCKPTYKEQHPVPKPTLEEEERLYCKPRHKEEERVYCKPRHKEEERVYCKPRHKEEEKVCYKPRHREEEREYCKPSRREEERRICRPTSRDKPRVFSKPPQREACKPICSEEEDLCKPLQNCQHHQKPRRNFFPELISSESVRRGFCWGSKESTSQYQRNEDSMELRRQRYTPRNNSKLDNYKRPLLADSSMLKNIVRNISRLSPKFRFPTDYCKHRKPSYKKSVSSLIARYVDDVEDEDEDDFGSNQCFNKPHQERRRHRSSHFHHHHHETQPEHLKNCSCVRVYLQTQLLRGWSGLKPPAKISTETITGSKTSGSCKSKDKSSSCTIRKLKPIVYHVRHSTGHRSKKERRERKEKKHKNHKHRQKSHHKKHGHKKKHETLCQCEKCGNIHIKKEDSEEEHTTSEDIEHSKNSSEKWEEHKDSEKHSKKEKISPKNSPKTNECSPFRRVTGDALPMFSLFSHFCKTKPRPEKSSRFPFRRLAEIRHQKVCAGKKKCIKKSRSKHKIKKRKSRHEQKEDDYDHSEELRNFDEIKEERKKSSTELSLSQCACVTSNPDGICKCLKKKKRKKKCRRKHSSDSHRSHHSGDTGSCENRNKKKHKKRKKKKKKKKKKCHEHEDQNSSEDDRHTETVAYYQTMICSSPEDTPVTSTSKTSKESTFHEKKSSLIKKLEEQLHERNRKIKERLASLHSFWQSLRKYKMSNGGHGMESFTRLMKKKAVNNPSLFSSEPDSNLIDDCSKSSPKPRHRHTLEMREEPRDIMGRRKKKTGGRKKSSKESKVKQSPKSQSARRRHKR